MSIAQAVLPARFRDVAELEDFMTAPSPVLAAEFGALQGDLIILGGMQQRASIARALLHDPKLILMDEPFGALDALTREHMNLELQRIWRESRKTIVFVTHGVPEAVFLGTRVVVLTAGPARMADNFEVELPSPRPLSIKTSEKFGAYAERIYRLLGMV